MVGYDALRAEQAERRDGGRPEAARDRPLDLRRDVRARAVARSSARSATSRAAGTRRRSAVLPTGTVQVVIGTSPHGQGHVTTLSQIVADRLGVPTRRVEVLHGDTAVVPLGMDTYGSRSLAVGGVALWHAAEKIVDEGADDRRAPARGRRGRPRGRTAARSPSPARPDDDGRRRSRSRPGRRTTCPTGSSRGSRRRAVYDPPNFSWPGGRAHRGRRGRHRDRRRRAAPLRRGRRRRQRDQPDDRRRADPRRHRAGRRRRRCSRRRSTTTTASC